MMVQTQTSCRGLKGNSSKPAIAGKIVGVKFETLFTAQRYAPVKAWPRIGAGNQSSLAQGKVTDGCLVLQRYFVYYILVLKICSCDTLLILAPDTMISNQ